MKNNIIIGIGANLIPKGFSTVQDGLLAAMNMLYDYGIEDIRRSSWYETSPVPRSEQPLFINAVFSATCNVDPHKLLLYLNEIETKIGRIRAERNAPRVIDMDILDFNSMHIETEKLVLPHPRMHQRAFVLIPLQEIRNDYIHPVTKEPILNLIRQLPDDQNILRI